MIPDGTYTAVVDRIEDGLATLELADDGDRYELVVDPEELPDPACHADAVLHVAVDDGDLVDATYDDAETEARRERSQSRFDRLSRRPSRDGDADSDRRSPD